MTREELLEQFDDVFNTIKGDDQLILKVLVGMFGNAGNLWDAVHTHITSIYEDRDLDDEVLQYEVENVVDSFRKVIDDIVERELLGSGIDENSN